MIHCMIGNLGFEIANFALHTGRTNNSAMTYCSIICPEPLGCCLFQLASFSHGFEQQLVISVLVNCMKVPQCFPSRTVFQGKHSLWKVTIRRSLTRAVLFDVC